MSSMLPPIRRTRLAILATVLTFATPLHAQTPRREQVDVSRIQARRDSFAVMLRGTERGWQVLSASRDGGGWVLGDAVNISGMVSQASSMRFDARMNEQSLRQEGTMMGKPMRITLDARNGRMTGTALTPSNPSGELAIDVPLTEGMIDDNAVTSMLAYVPWRDSLTATFTVLSSGKGTVSTFTAKATGTEAVTVPAGTFDAWRVELQMTNARVFAYVSTSAPYRIVKMSNGPAFEMVLVK